VGHDAADGQRLLQLFDERDSLPRRNLQPPFYDPKADDAFNYGGIGAVIGHEMTHGFDDSGAKFDADGNLVMWWTEDDFKKFNARTDCVVNQFDEFEVEPGLHQIGKLVVGESVADFGGLTVAYAAYKKSLEGKSRPKNIAGFTPEQRFFLGWAQVWAQNIRPEAARLASRPTRTRWAASASTARSRTCPPSRRLINVRSATRWFAPRTNAARFGKGSKSEPRAEASRVRLPPQTERRG
jgi:hypothetical protein